MFHTWLALKIQNKAIVFLSFFLSFFCCCSLWHFIWIRKCFQQKQQQKAQKLMMTFHGKHSKWVCVGHFRNTERYEISRNNFFLITEVIYMENGGTNCFNLALLICALSCVHLQSVPWTMRLILQKAPAKFFRLWTVKSWGPVPCMGATWWLVGGAAVLTAQLLWS